MAELVDAVDSKSTFSKRSSGSSPDGGTIFKFKTNKIVNYKNSEVSSYMLIFVVIYYVIFFVTLLYTLYFAITGIIGLLKRNKIHYKHSKKYARFAILIPARNESLVIGELLDSLNSLNYSKDKYSIYVIPNNCTDNTKDIVKEKNANIIDCTVKTKTKGDVLKFAFDSLKKDKKIDAYVIFDADNVVHPDFLKHMNDCYQEGYHVAEGFRDAKNPQDNWISGSYTLYYLLQNVFYNYTRMPLGGSASINGTGFMVQKKLIDKYGFETHTLTEDMEFTGLCALRGEKIAFVEDAITYDEYPNKFIPSWNQRKRWSAGILECMRLYSKKLFKNAFKNKSLHSFDISLTYICPIIQVLGFVGVIMLVLFRLFGIELNDIFSYFFASGIIYFIATYLLGILVEVITIKYKKKKVKNVVAGLLLFPLFIISWIPINIICLLKKHTTWDEIKHNRNININDVMKNN